MRLILTSILSIASFTCVLAQVSTDQSGNVGIGTTTPHAKLEVKAPTDFDGATVIRITNNATDYGRANLILTGRIQNGNDGWNFGSNARNAIVFSQNAASSNQNIGALGIEQVSMQLEGNSNSLGFLSKQQGNIPNLVITQGGWIGIATTTPRAIFDIAQPLQFGQTGAVLARLQEGNATGDGTSLSVKAYATQVNSTFTSANDVKSFSLEHTFYGNINSSINFYRGSGVTGGSIGFSTDNNSEKMRILYNGNVGIGTSSPDQKLTVNGTVHASQVKVDTQIPVPDYVFKKDYKLASLSTLKTYLDKNQHLPEIPSASEQEKEGLDLGKMNQLLLKKVEELTLYLIQQKQQTDQQVKLLKREISKIKHLNRQ